jgi:hypothetical protein
MHNRRTTSSAIIALLATAGLAATAQAAPNCGLTGKWHYDNFLAYGPGQGIADCSLTIKPTGVFTGTCSSWTLGQASSHGAVSGKIKADRNCNLSGFTRSPGLPDVTIRGGHVRGTTAMFVGTRGSANSPTNVRLVTMIKE